MRRLLFLGTLLFALPAATPLQAKQFSVPKASNAAGLQAWAQARKRGGNLLMSPFAQARASDTAHADAYQREAAALEAQAAAHGFELTLSSETACLRSAAGEPATEPQDFDDAGKKLKVKGSALTGAFLYFENSTFQAVAWPIGGSTLQAVALLPKSSFWLADIERDLAWGRLAGPLSKLGPRAVAVRMPRLKLGDAQTCVDARLESGGAVAAAEQTFKADHPFLLLIRDARSGLILFIGRVANPAR